MQILATGEARSLQRSARHRRSILSRRKCSKPQNRPMGAACGTLPALQRDDLCLKFGELAHLRDLWDDTEAAQVASDQLALLRYRSNLLGADLRITNFGGGNTSSKFELPDPFTGKPVRVLAVKGSGGDIGSITESGFAMLYLDRLEQLERALSRREIRGRNGAVLSAVGIRRESGSRLHRHRSARIPSLRPCRPSASRLGDRAGGQRQWQSGSSRNSTGSSAERSFGFLGSVQASNSPSCSNEPSRRIRVLKV